jgi:hypothetical protein
MWRPQAEGRASHCSGNPVRRGRWARLRGSSSRLSRRPVETVIEQALRDVSDSRARDAGADQPPCPIPPSVQGGGTCYIGRLIGWFGRDGKDGLMAQLSMRLPAGDTGREQTFSVNGVRAVTSRRDVDRDNGGQQRELTCGRRRLGFSCVALNAAGSLPVRHRDVLGASPGHQAARHEGLALAAGGGVAEAAAERIGLDLRGALLARERAGVAALRVQDRAIADEIGQQRKNSDMYGSSHGSSPRRSSVTRRRSTKHLGLPPVNVC